MKSSKCYCENLCYFLQGIWFLLKEYIFVFAALLIIFATSVLYHFNFVCKDFSIGIGGIALTVFFTKFPQKYNERKMQFRQIQASLVWFENIRMKLLVAKQAFIIHYEEDVKKVPQTASLNIMVPKNWTGKWY